MALPAVAAEPTSDGMVLWLAANDVDGDGVADNSVQGKLVAKWADKSGLDNHVTQDAGQRQPTVLVEAIGGHAALRFDGGDCLELSKLAGLGTGDQPFHALFVFKATMAAPHSNPRLLDLRGDDLASKEQRRGFWVGYQGNGRNRLGIAYGDEGEARSVSWNGQPNLLEVVYQGSGRWAQSINGEPDGAGTFTNKTFLGFRTPIRVAIGQHWGITPANTFFRGSLAEVLLYNRVLSADEQNEVGGYLGRKYRIATPYGPAPRFEKDVRPILAQACHKCHGDKKQEGKLDLRTVSAMLKGGTGGPVLVRGHAERSYFLEMIDNGEMPPAGEARLTADQVALLRRWVSRGGLADEKIVLPPPTKMYRDEHRQHWAFQQPALVTPPVVRQPNQVSTPIDAFVLKRLEDMGLAFSPPAERATLARRAWFDLTGLPPTTAELDAFLADQSPDAFAKVVDRLLDSPAYGQRWARHWLDVARYADYHDADPGKRQASCEPTEAWRYRDWVVDALNDDLPFDQFIKHQIAGDLMRNPNGDDIYPAGLIATTFLANGVWDRGDADKEKIVSDMADDQIDTIGKAFLGLTLGCARCHDHKFDPVSQADYYGLAGMFYSSHILQQLGTKGGEYTLLRVPLNKSEKPPLAMAIQEGGTPGGLFPAIQDVPIHIRGSYTRLGRVIPRRLPQFFAGDARTPIQHGSGRRELAGWVASPDNPLTARVIVNRVWQWHFGEGLVRTPNNFGMRSQTPTHPALLDWLAVQSVRDGWSLKKLHRLIMLSRTYQQSSQTARELRERDPENRWLGRFAPRRLDAEAIRDSMLFVSGQLDATAGGPAGDDFTITRRSLYVQTARWNRSNYASMFDAANPDASTAQRNVSTVAPQALFLLNSEFALTQSKHLAERLLRAVADDETARIKLAYRRLFSRLPRAEEVEVARGILGLAQQRDSVAAWTDLAHVLFCSNEFVYVD
ncbi:MAG: DUF1553 domain-containing protein [Planctomycetota bacterium]|nr:DUF1553 domain-containing protein [Planctomycetota bacterium]